MLITLYLIIQKKSSANKIYAFVLSGLLINACSYEHAKPASVPPTAFDPRHYHYGEVYLIQPSESEIRIKVFRSGSLAALGHNHIISNNDISGKVYWHPDLHQAGFKLQLPGKGFVVDRLDYRRAAGSDFASIPSHDDIKATLSNMLGNQVLDIEHFPVIDISSVTLIPELPYLNIRLRITLRGNEHDITTLAKLETMPNQLVIEGQLSLSQTTLSIVPFSILFGALSVKDELDIYYRITARREH